MSVSEDYEKGAIEAAISQANLSKLDCFDEADVFIVGYPRSGNTWFQNLVSGVVYGIDPELAPDALLQELVVDVHDKKYYFRFQTPMFFKSHFLPRPEYRRVIYLLRDGRDAMVSYFHFIKAITGNDNLDLINEVRNGTHLFPCKWYEHVEQWLANPYGAEIIIIKYEDLLSDPLDCLKRLCIFLGLERSELFLQQVIEKSSFAKMKKKETEFGWANKQWPKEKPFVRRGSVGSFRDEMPSAVLDEFLKEAGDTLKKVGYLNS